MTPEETERYNSLLLTLGMALGSLMDPAIVAALAESMRAGDLYRGYVQRLRDLLTEALRLSGIEERALPEGG